MRDRDRFTICLRDVCMKDADLLLKWRNDAVTRRFSRKTAEIAFDEHIYWLSESLKNPRRQIYIAEVDGTPVGTVRADFDGHFNELSWTVAPEERGRSIGKTMVRELARRLNSPIRAEVKKENLASVRIARFLGMSMDREYDGFLHFSKKSSR